MSKKDDVVTELEGDLKAVIVALAKDAARRDHEAEQRVRMSSPS